MDVNEIRREATERKPTDLNKRACGTSDHDEPNRVQIAFVPESPTMLAEVCSFVTEASQNQSYYDIGGTNIVKRYNG